MHFNGSSHVISLFFFFLLNLKGMNNDTILSVAKNDEDRNF